MPYERTLDAAEDALETLAVAGVRVQKRDFSDIIDVTVVDFLRDSRR